MRPVRARRGWAPIFLALAAAACSDDSGGMDDPCAMGICASDEAGNGAGSGAGSASGNGGTGGSNGGSGGIDMAGNGGSSAGNGGGGSGTGGSAGGGAGAGGGGGAVTGGTGGTGGTAAGTGGGSGGCTEAWLCTPWETSGGNDATRTCTDANACGTTDQMPAEAATLPALDLDDYKCNVEPILDRACAQLACHGTEDGRALRTYARGRLRMAGESLSRANVCLNPANTPPRPAEECTGSVECECWVQPHTANEWQRNFDAARGFALDAAGTPLADMADSELLRQPLVGSGLNHAGIKVFQQGDADYTKVLNWLEGTSQACADSALLQN